MEISVDTGPEGSILNETKLIKRNPFDELGKPIEQGIRRDDVR
jgi:hypothetical protein